jgi:beta-N-acetylhexosaminidase
MARSPYDALAFPEIGTVFAIYSDVPASLEMGAAALFGEAEPGGHMPITLPVILNES